MAGRLTGLTQIAHNAIGGSPVGRVVKAKATENTKAHPPSPVLRGSGISFRKRGLYSIMRP